MDITFQCRICFQLLEPLIDIYEENLCELLEKCGGIKVEQTDCQSKYLCKDCTSELLIAARFREKCERAIVNFIIENEKPLDYDLIIEESVEDEAYSEEVNVEPETNLVLNVEDQADEIEQDIANDFIQYYSGEAHDDCDANVEAEEYECDYSSQAVETDTVTPTVNDTTVDKQNFECDACGATFVQAINLRRHMEKSHKASELYACELCGHCFVSRDECEHHCINCNVKKKPSTQEVVLNEAALPSMHDKKRKGKSHACNYCGKVMATPFALNTHIRSHTGECPFSCDLCGKAFRTQSSLSIHLKRHAGMPDFCCSICGKRFYETSNLNVHMKTHTGEKPHRCKICNQSFARVFLLEIHTRTHTGEKPYKCDKCDRAFTQSCDLRYHLKTHTGERHYFCSICKKGFIKRNSLFLHMQRHKNMGTAATIPLDEASPQEQQDIE